MGYNINFQILDGDPASLWWELELRVSTKLPEDGDGAGPWLFFFIEAVMESRVIKSLFTHRYAIRVPAGNRWCTQIRIILKRGVLIKTLFTYERAEEENLKLVNFKAPNRGVTTPTLRTLREELLPKTQKERVDTAAL